MRKVSSLALLAAAFIGVAASAQAATVSFDSPVLGPTKTDWSSALTFTRFNPAWGTLTSVKLEVGTGIESTITVQNNASSASDGDVNTRMRLYVGNGTTLSNAGFVITTVTDDSFTYSLDPGDSRSSGLMSGSGGTTKNYSSGTDLNFFQTAGTISVPVYTFTDTQQANHGGNTSSDQVTDATATGTVTYYYTPIPEPMTFGLMGLSAAGLMIRRRQA